ncbi:MAG: hypothetical protein QF890_12040 [Myxococcota bacterium]|nr:hypothetical protein [bacterium]MDP6074534.1 hypothetical protein [Myxococcota bacterium]MDP6244467.1 hypothetical protein [Myxococcota bacterium]MDP7073919.1 hypothetical protein [Myxococcota bacterium]MDP7300432.1 hypothetical protein [Myxococcota bacterium]
MRRPGRLATHIAGLALGSALLLGPASARAGDEGTAYSGLKGVGAVVGTLVYAPLKVAYAAGGMVISGLAYVWTVGDTSVSGPIFYSAVRGDYVVLPAHLDGQSDLTFVGPPY